MMRSSLLPATLLLLSLSVPSFSFCPSPFARPNTRSRLGSKKAGGDVGTWTYMDGDDMDSVEAIEALGGDASFFLDAEPEEEETRDGNFEAPKSLGMEGKGREEKDDGWRLGDGPRRWGGVEEAEEDGGGKEFMWDGTVDEDAYFDE